MALILPVQHSDLFTRGGERGQLGVGEFRRLGPRRGCRSGGLGSRLVDIRRERRELLEDELTKLLNAAENGRTLFGLTGEQRRKLYVVAVSTGLRSKECGSLTPRHFELDADPPTVRIDAPDEKARRGDVLPIPSDLVKMLRPWLATFAPDAKLWPGDWAKKRRGSKIMMADLERAGVAYRNDDGHQSDFYALRHTYLSRLGRSGASPKAMQRLVRHTTVQLTLAVRRTPICLI